MKSQTLQRYVNIIGKMYVKCFFVLIEKEICVKENIEMEMRWRNLIQTTYLLYFYFLKIDMSYFSVYNKTYFV